MNSSIVFSPDGRTALSGTWYGALILWDVESGTRLHTFVEFRDYEPESTNEVTSVAFSPDGRYALSLWRDGLLMVWNMQTQEPIRSENGIDSATFGPSGHRILMSEASGSLVLWRIDTLDELIQWAYAHRAVRELSCVEQLQYRVEPFCEDVGNLPPRPPYMTSTPVLTPTTEPTRTITPTITPSDENG
jgi:WD40 repeat protein